MDKWIEIDAKAIEHNLREVESQLDAKTTLIAVIKANAYGHGAVETARILSRCGVEFFAVSFLEEALQLRAAGFQSRLLVFSPVISSDGIRDALLNQIILTIASEGDLQLIEDVCADKELTIKVHIKVETGLGRYGLNQEQAVLVYEKIRLNTKIDAEGIYTHTADPTSPASAEKQFHQFVSIVERLEQSGAVFRFKHIANSAVFLRAPHMHLDAVRIGTLLAGQHPVGDFAQRLHLLDPFSFKTRIVSVRKMPRGSRLGYFSTYTLKETAQVAVIPVGFHDGMAVEVANRPINLWDLIKKLGKIILAYFNYPGQNLRVNIGGHEYPVRGKVFMQMALLEVPLGLEIGVGEEVSVPVRKTLAAYDVVRVYLNSEDYFEQGCLGTEG